MVHDYVNPAGWSKQNAFLDTDVRLLRRSSRRSCAGQPEAGMPQSGEAWNETVKINSWLENHVGWPPLCNVLGAMRKRLLDATTRVKEVKEFPIGVIGRGLRAEYAECAGCFK